MKKYVPRPVKIILNRLVDFINWIKQYRQIPFVLSNKYNIKLIIYPINKNLIRAIASAHDNVKEFTAVKKLLQPNQTVLDVGANIGITSVYFSKLVGSNGTVYAFEPVTETFNLLKETIAINRAHNIQAYRLGISNSTIERPIHIFPPEHHYLNSLGNVTVNSHRPIATEIITVETIDNFCLKHGINRIDLLKIDVEGFEDEVIEGADSLLRQKAVTYVQFEISKMPLSSVGKKSVDIFSLLNKYSYQVYRFNETDEVFEGPLTDADNDFDNYYASCQDLTKL